MFSVLLTSISSLLTSKRLTLWGAALGALVLGVLPELLRSFAVYRMLIFGLLMILMMIFRPQGILGGQLIRRELKPRSSEGVDGDP